MSFKILAFDTSTEICSVALMVDNDIRECSGLVSYQNERRVLFMIDSLLSDAGISLKSLDCLVFSRGPGSFVGVRIGVSVAQGLALGTDLPLVQVSSLEILAEGIWRLIGAEQVLSTLNARLGELYLACYYRQDNNYWLRRDSELVIAPTDIRALVSKLDGKWVLVGTGWDRYPFLLSDDIWKIDVRKVLFPSARDMFPFAIISLKTGDLLSVEHIKSIYLSQPKWRKLFS